MNEGETLFDFMVESNGQWKAWADVLVAHACFYCVFANSAWLLSVPEYVYPQDHSPLFSSIFVPTVDNTRIDYLLDLLMSRVGSLIVTLTSAVQACPSDRQSWNCQNSDYDALPAATALWEPELQTNQLQQCHYSRTGAVEDSFGNIWAVTSFTLLGAANDWRSRRQTSWEHLRPSCW